MNEWAAGENFSSRKMVIKPKDVTADAAVRNFPTLSVAATETDRNVSQSRPKHEINAPRFLFLCVQWDVTSRPHI